MSKWAFIALLAIASACSSEKKEGDGGSSSSDIDNATEISLPLFATEIGNSGYGNILEIKSEQADDKIYFQKERNTEWYKFTINDLGDKNRLSFTIEPNEGSDDDYDFLLFRYTGEGFAKDVMEKRNLPIRSNLAKNSTASTTTGLGCEATEDYVGADTDIAFSNAVEVTKDEVYYLVVDHAKAGGNGYRIKFEYCGNGSGAGLGIIDSSTASGIEVPPIPTLPQTAAPVASTASTRTIRRQVSSARSTADDEEYYIVQPKNTVYSISTSHGMTVFDLLSRNRLTSNRIFIGQKLLVKKYNGSAPLPIVAKVDNTPEALPAPTPAPAAPEEAPVAVPAPPAETPAAVPVPPAPTPEKTEPVAATEPESTEPISPSTRTSVPKSSGTPAAVNSIEAGNAVPENVQKMYVYVNVVNSKNNNPINTIVQVVDGKNNKKIDRVSSNQLGSVPIYGDGGRRKIFILDAFSFRKETFELDLDNIKNDSSANMVSLVNDTIVLNFELERYKKKDIFAAYNIFFYDDASVMLPKSKYELESLLEMMRENPRTRIKIHGHTNSNSMGKIVTLEPGDHDFFRLSAKNKESFGTAQQLSKRRAESIKYFLQFNGVKDLRTEIKGWGGKKMIYEKDVPLAHKNKRVEIEILDE